MVAVVLEAVWFGLVGAMVSGVAAWGLGGWYGRQFYAERCRAMMVLAYGDDWDAIYEDAKTRSREALAGAPTTPFVAWRVWRHERDLQAWWKVRSWAMQQQRSVRDRAS